MRQVLLLGLVCAASVFAQNLTISGKVLDGNNLPISGATLTLVPQGKKPLLTESTSDGSYRFEKLTAGAHRLNVLKPGFAETTQPLNLTANLDGANITLALAEVSTSIVVEDVAGKSTATRMDVPNKLVPIQVGSVSAQVLEQRGVNDMVSALQNVSGVSATRWYGMYEYYTIRGFNIADVQLVDGMRLEGNRINTQLNNVDQIDVLKGPASVVYGGGALGGAINILRKKPAATRAYDLFYRGGRFNTNQVGGGLTGPIFNATRWLYRLDTSFENSDGWRQAGARRFNISPTLTWLISDRARVTVHQAFNRDRFDTDAGIPTGALAAGVPLDFRFNTSQDFGLVHDSQTHALLNVNLSPNWELRNGFFYRFTNDEYYSAEFLTFAPALRQVNREFLYFKHHRRPVLNQSDVLGRFTLFGMKHTLVAGYEYQDFYNFTDRSASRSVAIPPIVLADPVDRYTPVSSFPRSRRDHFTNQIHAFFWQDQVQLAKRLHLNVGGRFDDFNRASRNDPWANGQRTNAGPELRRNQEAYTYRAGLTYEVSEGQQLYFSSASSFQPVTQIPADGRELLPERGRSYEIGHRWQGLGGRLNLDTALYQIERQNVVIARPQQQFDQAGQQSSKGVDFDLRGNIGKGLRVIANYGYTLPRFDNFFISNGAVNLSGFRPRFTQRHAANLWLTKAWDNGFTVSAGSRYLSSMFTDNANRQDWRLGGWTTFSGAVSYRRGFYQLSLNADNLFNRQRYFVAGIYDGQVYPGSPINVFVTTRFFFR